MLGGRCKVLAIELSEQVLREASDWLARLSGGDAGAEDRVRLRNWLAAQPENRQAYDFVTETCGIAATVLQRAPVRSRNVSRQPIRRWAAVGGGLALAALLIAAIGIIALTP